MIGSRVRFAPNPRFPDRLVEAEVIRSRPDPRRVGAGPWRSPRPGDQGWLDTRDDAGFERSVRPYRCEVVS